MTNTDRLCVALNDLVQVVESSDIPWDRKCAMKGEEPLCCAACNDTGCIRYKIEMAKETLLTFE